MTKMELTDTIASLDYLFNKLIANGHEVSLELPNKAFIERCKVKSVNHSSYGYEISTDNGSYLYLQPDDIQLIRYDVIAFKATTYLQFKSTLAEAEDATGKSSFMVHFMSHDEAKSGAFLLTVKYRPID